MRIIRSWGIRRSTSTTARRRQKRWPESGGKEIVNLSADEIARATRGKIFFGDSRNQIEGVGSDSRQIRPGELFVPLQGPNFDGHKFIHAALGKGAAGSLARRGWEQGAGDFDFSGKFLVLVEDVLESLGELAHFWRQQQRALKVVAITGSNGKTTTKEMASQILAGSFRILKTEGNLNNLIGLPLMLLRLSPTHEVAVLEMGMNVPGEIRRLKEIAEPQISLITNIGRAHLEFLGSLEGVARAKGELWEGLKTEDWIAVNVDDPRVVRLAAPAKCRKKTFGMIPEAEVRGAEVKVEEGRGVRFSLTMEGKSLPVRLAAFGQHNVNNALGAASLASILGMNIEGIAAGLEKFQPYPGRGRIIPLGKNVHLLDEGYNSNPDSLEATLSAFSAMKGKSRGLLVLGDMLEIGPDTTEAHEKAGRQMGGTGFAHLFCLGEMGEYLARGAKETGMDPRRIHLAKDYGEILADLGDLVEEGDWILIKGSRKMRMERIVEGLIERLGRP
ncbi:MAG: UDP-N-acetylmuramoyl-tripeptide--D-alanyl-D-alanine ligase [Thermodesulfobacteriota bacterium]|jgi:UDP-N-acetylmuramoyl-tripeptide--D-alanyl-D-alanine ligase